MRAIVSDRVASICSKGAEHYEPGKPDGYLDRQDWFREMAKTHRQTKCGGCGLYVIWRPKRRAKKRTKRTRTHDAGCVCRNCKRAAQAAAKESGF